MKAEIIDLAEKRRERGLSDSALLRHRFEALLDPMLIWENPVKWFEAYQRQLKALMGQGGPAVIVTFEERRK